MKIKLSKISYVTVIWPVVYFLYIILSPIDPLVTYTESIGYRFFGAERWFKNIPNIFLQGESSSIFRLIAFYLANNIADGIKFQITLAAKIYGFISVFLIAICIFYLVTKKMYFWLFSGLIIWIISEFQNPKILKFDYHTFLIVFIFTILVFISMEFKKESFIYLNFGLVSAILIAEKISYVSLVILLSVVFVKAKTFNLKNIIIFTISYWISFMTIFLTSYKFQIGVFREKLVLMESYIGIESVFKVTGSMILVTPYLIALILIYMYSINGFYIKTISIMVAIVIPIIFYLLRRTPDTKSESLSIILLGTFVLISMLRVKNNTKITSLFLIFVCIFFINLPRLESWKTSAVTVSNVRGKIVWSIYDRIIESNQKTLLIYPDDNWNASNFGEALMKGYAATPSWFVRTRERNYLERSYPLFHYIYKNSPYTEPDRIDVSSFNYIYFTSHQNLPNTLQNMPIIPENFLNNFKCNISFDYLNNVNYYYCEKNKSVS